MHLNALYDLLKRRYMDAVLQDSRDENENKALINMLENFKHDSIIVADTNYDSYNNIAHLENKGLKYVICIKSTTGIVKKFNLPLNEEADFEANILLTIRLTKRLKRIRTNTDFSPKIRLSTFFHKVQKRHIRSNSGS
ncbi:MAG: transposase [Ruminococcus sp.]|nr:transposase [Ruminococcus sp.]